LYAQGSFESTSESTDLAIGGQGFFIVNSPDNDTNYYTRAGQFRFDKEGNMTNPAGYILQGREIDRATNAPSGVNKDVVISPEPSKPRATETIGMAVNLQSDADWKGAISSLAGAGTSINTISASEGKYPRVGDYAATVSGTTLTVEVDEIGPDGELTGDTTTYTGTVAAGTTYTDWQGSGLDIITASGLANGTQTFDVTGFQYDYVSSSQNPTSTSNYSSSVTVYDSLGQEHVVNVYF